MSTAVATRSPGVQWRRPTGKPSWPCILLAGMEGAGKSWAWAQQSARPEIGMTYVIYFAEKVDDEYGAIPGANYVLTAPTTYDDLVAAVQDAVAQPRVSPDKPNMIVLDSGSMLWSFLSDEAQDVVNDRERRKKAAGRKTAGFADRDGNYTVGPDMWNRAKDRWYDAIRPLLSYDGIVIITSRFEETVVMENGQPTKDRVWKVKAQKNLPFDVDVVVEMRSRKDRLLTKTKSVVLQLDEDESRRLPGFTVAGLLELLGISAGTVGGGRDYTEPVRDNQAAMPDGWRERLEHLVSIHDLDGIYRLHDEAKEQGLSTAVARIRAAGLRVRGELGLSNGPTAAHNPQRPVESDGPKEAPRVVEGSVAEPSVPAAAQAGDAPNEGDTPRATEQMHENVRHAVKDWAGDRFNKPADPAGPAPADTPPPPAEPTPTYSQADKNQRVRLRSNIDKHIRAGSVGGLTTDLNVAKEHDWTDLWDYAAHALDRLENPVDGAGAVA